MTFNVYTDASILEDKESGVGIVIYCTELSRIIYSVGMYVNLIDSVTLAEIVAITCGMKEVKEVIADGGYTPKLIRICSDSTSALDLVTGEGSTDDEYINDMIALLDEISKEIECDIEYQWVRSHSDHRMNDLADYLAYHHAQG